MMSKSASLENINTTGDGERIVEYEAKAEQEQNNQPKFQNATRTSPTPSLIGNSPLSRRFIKLFTFFHEVK